MSIRDTLQTGANLTRALDLLERSVIAQEAIAASLTGPLRANYGSLQGLTGAEDAAFPPCDTCRGTGILSGGRCPRCDGQGVQRAR